MGKSFNELTITDDYMFYKVLQDTEICLQDGAVKIMINSSAAAKVENAELRAFMEYMNGRTGNDPFVRLIDDRIRTIKDNEVNRMEYFSWTAKKMDLLREGRREGRKEGIKEGGDRLAAVLNHLIEQGRSEEAERIIRDADYRETVLSEQTEE